jgi:hypothetical protein
VTDYQPPKKRRAPAVVVGSIRPGGPRGRVIVTASSVRLALSRTPTDPSEPAPDPELDRE